MSAARSTATRSAILTILYDQATEGTMEPVVIAMSSAFNAFPAGAQAAGPPPRKKVEYAPGIVVSADGAIVTDRQAVDGCVSIAVAGYGNADHVAEDKDARSRAAAHLRCARAEAAERSAPAQQVRHRSGRHCRSASQGGGMP